MRLVTSAAPKHTPFHSLGSRRSSRVSSAGAVLRTRYMSIASPAPARIRNRALSGFWAALPPSYAMRRSRPYEVDGQPRQRFRGRICIQQAAVEASAAGQADRQYPSTALYIPNIVTYLRLVIIISGCVLVRAVSTHRAAHLRAHKSSLRTLTRLVPRLLSRNAAAAARFCCLLHRYGYCTHSARGLQALHLETTRLLLATYLALVSDGPHVFFLPLTVSRKSPPPSTAWTAFSPGGSTSSPASGRFSTSQSTTSPEASCGPRLSPARSQPRCRASSGRSSSPPTGFPREARCGSRRRAACSAGRRRWCAAPDPVLRSTRPPHRKCLRVGKL